MVPAPRGLVTMSCKTVCQAWCAVVPSGGSHKNPDPGAPPELSWSWRGTVPAPTPMGLVGALIPISLRHYLGNLSSQERVRLWPGHMSGCRAPSSTSAALTREHVVSPQSWLLVSASDSPLPQRTQLRHSTVAQAKVGSGPGSLMCLFHIQWVAVPL